MTSRWKALTVYATDGRLEMSNNAAERAIRPLALGRKTISSAVPMPVAIAQRSSTPSSKPAKMNGINPQAYLADVIERIADHPANRVDELLPWNWTPRSWCPLGHEWTRSGPSPRLSRHAYKAVVVHDGRSSPASWRAFVFKVDRVHAGRCVRNKPVP